ncbi:hypothetical protein ABZ392_33755 [Streptomyces sp. NPDC005885]|uniref:hypothetical protein n=1 Tax=Streptomyces sp. NPDC005885 TaxID=3157079 RepID=UPI0033E51925
MNKYRIEAPVRSFSGTSVGVTFSKGTGYVTDETKEGRAAIEYFRRQHYGVALADETTEEERVQELVTGTPAQRDPIVSDEPFDPAKQKVEEVLAYLDEADLDEATRVLDAEAAAKTPRVGITSKREEILAAKTPAAPAGDDTKGAEQ